MKKDYEQGDRVKLKNIGEYFDGKTGVVLYNKIEVKKQNLVVLVDNAHNSRIHISYSNVRNIKSWFHELI